MWKRRQIFNAIFFFGTVIAGIGWMGELKDLHIVLTKIFTFGNLAITGHLLQVTGIFGNMLTPDAEKVEE